MNEVRATSIFDVFEKKNFQVTFSSTKDGDTPAIKLDILKNYFLEKLLLTRKPDWLSPYLLRYWSCSPRFYLKKDCFPR